MRESFPPNTTFHQHPKLLTCASHRPSVHQDCVCYVQQVRARLGWFALVIGMQPNSIFWWSVQTIPWKNLLHFLLHFLPSPPPNLRAPHRHRRAKVGPATRVNPLSLGRSTSGCPGRSKPRCAHVPQHRERWEDGVTSPLPAPVPSALLIGCGERIDKPSARSSGFRRYGMAFSVVGRESFGWSKVGPGRQQGRAREVEKGST